MKLRRLLLLVLSPVIAIYILAMFWGDSTFSLAVPIDCMPQFVTEPPKGGYQPYNPTLWQRLQPKQVRQALFGTVCVSY